MKYVIWGAGNRGKKALSIIGQERVLMFIDENKELHGSKVYGKSVYGSEKLNEICEPHIILITPVDYSIQIARKLEAGGKYNYFLFNDDLYGLDMSEYLDSMSLIGDIPEVHGCVMLYGITWFTLYLYDYFTASGKKVLLYKYGSDNATIIELVGAEYCVVSGNEYFSIADCIIAPFGIEEIPKGKYIDIETLVEKTYPIAYPDLSKYKNIHLGNRCFIVATGPSLKICDLDKLESNHEICISMNRIYNLFDRTKWRPDYYVIEDMKMIEDLAEEIVDLDIENKFVSDAPQKYWDLKGSNTSIKYKMIMQNCMGKSIGFSMNPDRYVYNGYTVTYVCLQLAVYMGFSDIFLLGVDFNYSEDIYSESNHFDGYQKHYKDIRLNPVQPEKMKRSYERAKQVAESKGIHIYNATRGGRLEVFERVNLDNIIS